MRGFREFISEAKESLFSEFDKIDESISEDDLENIMNTLRRFRYNDMTIVRVLDSLDGSPTLNKKQLKAVLKKEKIKDKDASDIIEFIDAVIK